MYCCHITPAYLITFFFYISVAHPALHSFPTRRSSDLSFLSHLLKVPSAIDSPIWGINTSTRAIGSPQYAASHLAALDRKSTRLNSSHITNSYAVFCLKKKTTQPLCQ